MLKQFRCALDHCTILKPDTTNYKFVLLECNGCKDRNHCIEVKRTREKEVNK